MNTKIEKSIPVDAVHYDRMMRKAREVSSTSRRHALEQQVSYSQAKKAERENIKPSIYG